MKLQAFLDIHIQWMMEMLSKVEPYEDLPPLLSFAGVDNRVTFLPMPSVNNKSQWARDKLEDAEAAIYATINAGYIVLLDELEIDVAERLEPLVAEHGTDHPEVRPYRRECYIVSAGDRDGTLFTVFLVERNRNGRIAQLVEHKTPLDFWGGTMADLLVTRH